MSSRLKLVIQLLAQHQSKETEEDMPANGLVPLIEDRACFQQGFDVPVDPLHPPNFFDTDPLTTSN
jgi:hypothetical protein